MNDCYVVDMHVSHIYLVSTSLQFEAKGSFDVTGMAVSFW